MKTIDVDMDYLIFAYQDEAKENIYYLDTEYGDVRLVNQGLENLKDLTDELELSLHKFLYVPKQSKNELTEDLQSFVESVSDTQVKKILLVGFESPHPIEAFKTILTKYNDDPARLNSHLKERSKRRLLQWLEANALAPSS